MKKIEKIGKGVLALSILANTFMPLGIVSAEDPQPYTITITTSNPDWIVAGIDNGIQVYKKTVPELTQLGVVQVRDKATNAPILVEPNCHDNTCLFSGIDANKTVNIAYNSETFDVTTTGEGGCLVDPGYDINGNLSVDIKEPAPNPIGKCGTQGNDPEPPQIPFDGHAVLVWSCGEGGAKVCYKEFTNLSGSEVNYMKASDITADNIAGAKFDVHANVKFFAPPELFANKKDAIDNQDTNPINPEDLVGPPNGDKGGVQYQSVGEPISNNAYTSYGDRSFKAIIYGEDFKGITIGSLDDLHYYPQKWNNWFLRTESYDMSGTTKEHPIEIDTVLLEKKINLKLQTDLNDYEVTEVEALDVPENAVVITKKNDGTYDIEFASNFYNKVVFKVTTSDNKEQYIYINRRTIDPFIRTGTNPEIVAEVFYDRETSYEDYDVIAKVVNKDGSSKIVHLVAEKIKDDGLGHPLDDYEIDEETYSLYPNNERGRGMKRAFYSYNMSTDDLKKVDKIYINVERSGSTKNYYEGNFAGSGKGDVLDMKYWEDRL